MQINKINNQPSFGIKAPIKVRKQLLRAGNFFCEADEAVKDLGRLRNDKICLSSVKFTEYLDPKGTRERIPFPNRFTIIDMIFRFKTPKTNGVVKIQEQSMGLCVPEPLYNALFRGVQQATGEYIEKTLYASAKKGNLEAVSKDLKKSFPISRNLIDKIKSTITK